MGQGIPLTSDDYKGVHWAEDSKDMSQNTLTYLTHMQDIAFERDMWEKNNSYNSPVNQMIRYSQAGINGAFGVLGGDAGNAEMVSAPGYGSFANPMSQITEMVGTLANSLQGVGSSIVDSVNQTRQVNPNISLTREQIAKTREETNAIRQNRTEVVPNTIKQMLLDQDKTKQEIDNLKAQKELTEADKKRVEELTALYQDQQAQVRASIDQICQQTDAIREQLAQGWRALDIQNRGVDAQYYGADRAYSAQHEANANDRYRIDFVDKPLSQAQVNKISKEVVKMGLDAYINFYNSKKVKPTEIPMGSYDSDILKREFGILFDVQGALKMKLQYSDNPQEIEKLTDLLIQTNTRLGRSIR